MTSDVAWSTQINFDDVVISMCNLLWIAVSALESSLGELTMLAENVRRHVRRLGRDIESCSFLMSSLNVRLFNPDLHTVCLCIFSFFSS